MTFRTCQDVSQAFGERTDVILLLLGKVLGGPRLVLDCFLQGLGSFWEALGARWGRFGGLWLTVEGFQKHCGAQTGNPKLIVAYSCSEIIGFKGRLGAFESTLGAVGSIRVDLRGPKNILADRCSEINVFTWASGDL